MESVTDLIGQPVATRLLDYYLHNGLPPLLILHGADGTGKFTAAERLVRQFLCSSGNGCNHCRHCRMFLRQEHPDYIRLPEDKIQIGDEKDPAPNTVRWLLRTRLCYAPFEGSRRFILAPRADLILDEAITALLKTLEEPPEHTRFIFLVHDLRSLKETILSRGVIVPFQSLPRQAMLQLADVDHTELGEIELQLLGGSLEYLPLLRSELYPFLKSRCEEALSHPLALIELEKLLTTAGNKTSEVQKLLGEEEYSYEEILEVAGVLLLCFAQQHHANRGSIARAVLEFKGGLHRKVAGLTPYLISRLFARLQAIMCAP